MGEVLGIYTEPITVTAATVIAGNVTICSGETING